MLLPQLSQELLTAIKARIKSYPHEVNEQDILGISPCHLAVILDNVPFLEILVFEGGGDLHLNSANQQLPSLLTITDNMKNSIAQLNLETKRRADSHGQHLHDILRNRKNFSTTTDFEKAIKERVLKYPHEVNEKTYRGRNAIHWCAYYNHIELIPTIKELCPVAELDAKDQDNLTPTSLIAKRAYRASRKHLLGASKGSAVASKSEKEQKKEVMVAPRIGEIPRRKPLLGSLSKSVNNLDPIIAISQRLRTLFIADTNPHRAYLDPMLKALYAQQTHFLVFSLEQGYPLAELDRALDCSTLSFAFREEMGNTFSALITYGACLRSYQFFHEQPALKVELLQSEKRREILIMAQNNVLEGIHWKNIQNAKADLYKVSFEVSELLNQQGLQSICPASSFTQLSIEMIERIAQSAQLPVALLSELYQICSYSNSELAINENRLFNREEIAFRVAALNSHYKPLEILTGLLKLQHELTKPQQLALFYVLNEVLLKSRPLTDHELRTLSSVVLPVFFKRGELNEFYPPLSEILKLRLQAQEVMVDNYHYLESLIQQYVPIAGLREVRYLLQFLNESTTLRSVNIAQALKSYSLVLFQDLQLNELANFLWKGPNKEQNAPSVCAIEHYFNFLSSYVAQQILKHENANIRAGYIKLYIKVAHELITSEVPDYNSAMAIYSALNLAPISRLGSTFALLNKKTLQLLDVVSATLTQEKNFKIIRESLAANPCAIPYIGMVTSDLTFAQENKSVANQSVIKGKVLDHLDTIKQAVSLYHLPSVTNVGHFIREFQLVNEDQLYANSLALESRPITLGSAINVAEIKKTLEDLKRNGCHLKVIKENPLTDKDALVALTDWLREKYMASKISIDAFSELTAMANNLTYPDVQYAINPIYFQLRKHPSQQYLRQFEQSRVVPEPGLPVKPLSKAEGPEKYTNKL